MFRRLVGGFYRFYCIFFKVFHPCSDVDSMYFLQGLETVDNSYFITEDNVGMLKLAKEAGTILVRSCTPVSCITPIISYLSFILNLLKIDINSAVN